MKKPIECSIGYSFDGEEVFIDTPQYEEINMVEVIAYLNEAISEKFEGRSVADLTGLSILIK